MKGPVVLTVALGFCAGCPAPAAPVLDGIGVATTDGGDPSMSGEDSGPGISAGFPADSTDAGPTSASGETENSGSATDSGSGATGPGGACGDDMAEGDEVCDGTDLRGADCVSEGFAGGTLTCSDDCSALDATACEVETCGDGMVDGADVCDGADLAGATCISVGFDSGALACAESCAAYDTSGCGTCGDDTLENDEVCDGAALDGESCGSLGFAGGALSCAADCSGFDTSQCTTCGNGAIDAGEACDGVDLGGESCLSLGAGDQGVLACSAACAFDTSDCSGNIPFDANLYYAGFASLPGVLPCDEISLTGTATGLTDDDFVEVPIGFTMTLHDVPYTDLTIQSNGTLLWSASQYLTYMNACLPTATAPSDSVLYVFWDDLDPSSGAGEIYYQTLGAAPNRRFVVQWDTANFSGDTVDLMRLQAMFNEASGQIDVCYVDTINAGNAADNGAEATAGLQLDSATGVQFSCNTPDLVNGMLLEYVPI